MPIAQEYMIEPSLAQATDSVSKIIGLLKAQKQPAPHVVIVDQDTFKGMVDGRALVRFAGNAETTKAAKIARPVHRLTLQASEEEIVEAFLANDVNALPVVKAGKVLGVVPRTAALQILSKSSAVKGKRVEELMTKPPITTLENTTIAEAEAIMHAHGVQQLVVTDVRGRLAGVLSTYDIATKVNATTKAGKRESTFLPDPEVNVRAEPISSIMTTDVVTIQPQTTIKEALKVMLQAGRSNLVVADGEKPVGMLTDRDALELVTVIPTQKIFILGLREDEQALRQSLVDEAQAFVERMSQSARVDYIALHIRSTMEGVKRRYQVRARVNIGGHLHMAGSPDLDPHRKIWDASMAVREVLERVEKIFYKHHKMDLSRHHKDRMSDLETEE